MCETDLVNALTLTRRNRTHSLLCWEDALSRSKTITLKSVRAANKNTNGGYDHMLAAQKFYLAVTPPRPPLLTPFTGEVTWQCKSRCEAPDTTSDLLAIWIISNENVSKETQELLSAYPPVSQWKFDIYLTDLTAGSGPKSHALLDRSPHECPLCLRVPLLSLLPKGRTLEDLNGHSIKVSANGVWPLRFYLVNTVIKLGDSPALDAMSQTVRPSQQLNLPDHDPEHELEKCFTPTLRLAELNALMQTNTERTNRLKDKPTPRCDDMTIQSVSPDSITLRGESTSPRGTDCISPRTRAVGGSSRRPHRPVPPAQKSFQKLLQMRQRSRFESMSKIEKNQIGIRVLANMSIRE